MVLQRRLVDHIERPKGSALWGPLIAFALAAIFCGLIAIATLAIALWIVAALFIGASVWWAFSARAIFQIDRDAVRVSAPFFTYRVQTTAIKEVRVQPDDGANHGFVNWPVSRIHGTRLIRVNMGGTASVTVSQADGIGVQLVVRTQEDAIRLASAIRC